MKATELRIGNYITIENNDSWKELSKIPMVVFRTEFCNDELFPNSTGAISCASISFPPNNYHQYDEFIQPIPLTEEWLVKFGFENKAHLGMCLADYSNGRIEFLDNKIFLMGADDERIGNEIQFVHQLQNIYFILTSEQLVTK